MRNKLLIPVLIAFACSTLTFSSCTVRGWGRGEKQVHLAGGETGVRFFVIGDWGEKGTAGQQAVANAMEQRASLMPPHFIVSSGDNFYDAGVSGISDPQWQSTFENIYKLNGVSWFPVLGNHDYILDPQAQVDYSQISGRWKMEERYYSKKFQVGNDSLLILFIDTEPIERELRGIVPDGVKIASEFTTRQRSWMINELSASRAKWKMVVGHHPVNTGGARRHSSRTRKMRAYLHDIFEKYKVDIYWSGHEHQLEYIVPRGYTRYVISGAGSHTSHLGYLKAGRRFAARQTGFVECKVTSDTVELNFINNNKQILYTDHIRK